MNKIHSSQLESYIKKAAADNRLNTSHLSIYLALLACWQDQNYIDQFRISRKEVMQLSKIAAISTYHRCMKQLILYGYFHYKPEYDSYKGSKVMLI